MQKLNISGIKKQKKMLFYSIIGTILLTGILFFFLFAHLKNLHEERIFGNKINIPKYELVIIPRKNCHHEEKKLFTYNQTTVSGICIKQINLQYKKKEISLEKALKKEYITLEDAMMKASNSFYNEDHTFMKFRFLNNENNFYVTFKKDWNENPKVIFSK